MHRHALHPEEGGERLVPGLEGVGDHERPHAVDEVCGRAVVIVVEVREHEQVDAADAEQLEAGVEPFGVGARVDERDRARRAHDERVALTHVARGVAPVGGERGRPHERTAECGTGERRQHDAHERTGAPGGHPCTPAAVPQHPGEHGADREGGEHEGTGHTARPGQHRERPARHAGGDETDPLRREPREPQHRGRE